jgi:hypothetical protein
MMLVGIELTRFTRDVGFNKDLIPLGVTLAASLAMNMAVGFLAGLAAHKAVQYFSKKYL